ncbi:hypothetical protein [Nonomuraea wenchangensis]|uniref:hypothetical protein n=1 Tax=Nonomuraea wenchangensis TaxID=568860 RepID=UPI0034054A47
MTKPFTCLIYNSEPFLSWARPTSAQVASPLARRPYDLRHAAVSLWLNGDVPAPEVAARAGHGVDVLFRVYAKCIDGQEEIVNQRIADVFTA